MINGVGFFLRGARKAWCEEGSGHMTRFEGWADGEGFVFLLQKYDGIELTYQSSSTTTLMRVLKTSLALLLPQERTVEKGTNVPC